MITPSTNGDRFREDQRSLDWRPPIARGRPPTWRSMISSRWRDGHQSPAQQPVTARSRPVPGRSTTTDRGLDDQ
jgi:hypothetical protein